VLARRLLVGALSGRRGSILARPPSGLWHRSYAAVSEPLEVVLKQHELTPEDTKGPLPDAAVLEARLNFLQSIGVPNVGNAVRRHPPLVDYEVEAMKPRLEYLLSLGIHEVGPMVERAPQLLNCDIRRDLQRKVAILQTLGLTKVARWVAKNPELVNVDLEEEMRPVVMLLRSVEGLQLPRVLGRLSWRHYKNVDQLQAQLDHLRALVGDKLGAMVSRNPRILTTSLANIDLKVEWLKSAGFGDVGGLVAREPQLVLMSLEGLEAKLQFVLKDMGRSIEEVERFPQVLNYSLQHLANRHSFLSNHGVADKHSLSRMFRSSLWSLCTKLAKQPLQHLDGTDGEPLSAAETWLEKNTADKAASHVRGLQVEAMRRIIVQAGTPPEADAGGPVPTAGVEA